MFDLSWHTPEIVEVQREHLQRLQSLYDGSFAEPFLCIAGPWAGTSHGLWGTNHIDMLRQPDAWLAECLSDMATKAHLYRDRRTLRAPVIEVDPFGTHLIDALMGAEVGFQQGQVWARELTTPLRDLRMPDLEASPLLAATLRLLRRAAEVTEGKVSIALPVLSCPINIAINLFGARFLEAIYGEPEEARHVARVCTDVIVEVTRRCQACVPEPQRRTSVACDRYMPPGHGLIDGCATQLVSADAYGEFLAPCDRVVLGCYARGSMIHLCGASTHCARLFAQTEGIRTIQLNDRAMDDLPAYLAAARPDQVFYLMPTQTIPWHKAVEMMNGRPFVLQAPYPGE